jgi:surface antigen
VADAQGDSVFAPEQPGALVQRHVKHVVGVLLAGLTMTFALTFALAFAAAPAQAAGNDYPYRYDTTSRIDPWTFTRRQCVSFAAWRLAQRGSAVVAIVRGWGNAKDWDNHAANRRIRVTTVPKVGAIAQWNAAERSSTYTAGVSRPTGWVQAGSYGHVAVVRTVHTDGTVTVEQYNGTGDRSYSTKRLKAPRYLYIGLR